MTNRTHGTATRDTHTGRGAGWVGLERRGARGGGGTSSAPLAQNTGLSGQRAAKAREGGDEPVLTNMPNKRTSEAPKMH